MPLRCTELLFINKAETISDHLRFPTIRTRCIIVFQRLMAMGQPAISRFFAVYIILVEKGRFNDIFGLKKGEAIRVFLHVPEIIVFCALELLFIWRSFGFCLLFLLFYVIFAPIPAEGTSNSVVFSWCEAYFRSRSLRFVILQCLFSKLFSSSLS